MRTFVADSDHIFSFCVFPDHWKDGDHPLGDLSDALNPIWDETCELNFITLEAGTMLVIDDIALNGGHVGDQCLAQGSVEEMAN